MKKVKTLFKNLSASIVLSITSSLAIVPSIVVTTLSETAEALTVDDIFNFAKSKGIKDRSNISEYNDLLDYDRKKTSNKSIADICEKYKVTKTLECVNNLDKNCNEKVKKCIAIFLDRIFHGLDKINYKNGLDEIKTFLKSSKKTDKNKYNIGKSYVTGFIVQEMLYDICDWFGNWSIEYNYHCCANVFYKYFKKNNINIDKARFDSILAEDVKNCILYLFEGTEQNPIGDLEQTILDVRHHVIDEHINKYADEEPILLGDEIEIVCGVKQCLTELKKDGNIDVDAITWKLRSPKKNT